MIMVLVLYVTFVAVVVPVDWCGACYYQMYDGIVTSINALTVCVVSKLFGRVLIKRTRDGTECAIREEGSSSSASCETGV